MSSQRTGVLELAVLGLLHETPMHGYELRKRLNSVLGAFRAFGYGSLYPCLKDLTLRGLIAEDAVPEAAKSLAGRRSKIVYRLTADGKEYLQDLLSQTGPASWEDDGFGVRFAFFGLTTADVRCGSSRAGAAGWRSGSSRSGPGSRGPGSGSTATPSSCSGMAWSRSSAKFAG